MGLVERMAGASDRLKSRYPKAWSLLRRNHNLDYLYVFAEPYIDRIGELLEMEMAELKKRFCCVEGDQIPNAPDVGNMPFGPLGPIELF
jgi:hypothetical protein